MVRRLLIGLLLLTMMIAPAFAQETAPAGKAATDEVSMSEEGNVSLDFREADIQNVLRILSYKSGVNIVAGPEVSGLVTIRLNDVPWQKALQVVLETYGFAYEKRGNIISVTTIENLKKRRDDASVLSEQEPLVTETHVLNYAKAADVLGSIEKMRTERGHINFDERTNTIIVRDIPENAALIADVIATLDRTTPQVLIEAKIIETTLSNSEKMGIDWLTQVTVSGAARPTTWPFTDISNNKYLDILNSNDVPTKGFPQAEDTEFSFGTLNFSQLQAVLEMLSSRSDTNILSNPRIVTLDNQTANIVVGSQYPLPQYDYNEEQARLQISGWDYKDIGIIFEVTPHVNNAGYVTLDLSPKITAILDFVTVENTSVPQLSTEEAHTQVMIKDGDTLVIAGLIKDQTSDVIRKVPFLGDIPLLGWFFKKKEKTVTKTDLMIFLTPHIITAVDN